MVVTARYYRVSPQYWHVSRDWEDRLRLLGLYVQTCEHRTTEGLYRLPLAYIAADLAWPIRTVEAKLGDLQTTTFVKYDRSAEVILLLDALEVQAPKTKDQVLGAIRRLQAVPATSLLLDLHDLASTHSTGLAVAMREQLGLHSGGNPSTHPSANPSGHPSGNGVVT